jgi:hypothetical protein
MFFWSQGKWESWAAPVCVMVAFSLDEAVWHRIKDKNVFSIAYYTIYYFMPEMWMFGLNISSCLKLKGSLHCSREIDLCWPAWWIAFCSALLRPLELLQIKKQENPGEIRNSNYRSEVVEWRELKKTWKFHIH